MKSLNVLGGSRAARYALSVPTLANLRHPLILQVVKRRQPNQQFRMTRAKHLALQFLAEYFVLTTNTLAQLRRSRIPNRNDQRTEQRTLLLLFKAGYVHRIPYFDLNQTNGGATYAYGLNDKSVAIYGGKSFDDHSLRTLDHELGITEFHIELKRLCEANGLTLRWQQSDLKRGIHPDAYFSIADPTKDDGKQSHFFLEIERCKIGHVVNGVPSIIKKLSRYYDFYNTEDCKRDWGFLTYRVVTVLQTDERRTNLLRAMQDELNHRMFWLGVDSSSAADFRTPKGDTFSFAELW
jgi:hypothetical protein